MLCAMLAVAAVCGLAVTYREHSAAIWICGAVLALALSIGLRWGLRMELRRLERAVQTLPEFAQDGASLPENARVRGCGAGSAWGLAEAEEAAECGR